ncbi:MAG: hypothetical protein ACI4EQ_02970 [Lachnospiraceae bacterium]
MNYQIMYYGGLVTFLLFLIISVVLFFAFNIGKIIGILSGYSAKKNIKKIRENSKKEMDAVALPVQAIAVKHGKTTTKLISDPAIHQITKAVGQETTLLMNLDEVQETTLLVNQTVREFRMVIDVLIANSKERI